MILYRYRVPAAAILFGALLLAILMLMISDHAAHADPVAAVVTAPAVVEVTSWAMMAVAALAGAVAALSAIGTALHFVAPRTKTTLDDRAAAVVDTVRADLAEVLAAVRAFVPGGSVVQELAAPAPAASPVTVNVHPPAAPSAPAPGTMTTTTVGPIA